MSEWRKVASVDQVAEGSLHPVELEDLRIVIARVGERVYALEDRCSHEEFALSSGELVGTQVTCVLHGARFDLETGAPRALPAVRPVRTFESLVQGREIQVRLG